MVRIRLPLSQETDRETRSRWRLALLQDLKKNLSTLREFLFTDVRMELKKVSWPDRVQVVSSTQAVVVSVAILSIYVGCCDAVFNYLLRMTSQ